MLILIPISYLFLVIFPIVSPSETYLNYLSTLRVSTAYDIAHDIEHLNLKKKEINLKVCGGFKFPK